MVYYNMYIHYFTIRCAILLTVMFIPNVKCINRVFNTFFQTKIDLPIRFAHHRGLCHVHNKANWRVQILVFDAGLSSLTYIAYIKACHLSSVYFSSPLHSKLQNHMHVGCNFLVTPLLAVRSL